MISKAKIFVSDAGKVIMIISLILMGAEFFWTGKKNEHSQRSILHELKSQPGADTASLDKQYATAKLENSYAGILGKSIEPAIAPLGYDWKIGIALITSFAAREVFVGTMATLYSVGDEENDLKLKEKMKAAVQS